jgi:hypothetical protein
VSRSRHGVLRYFYEVRSTIESRPPSLNWARYATSRFLAQAGRSREVKIWKRMELAAEVDLPADANGFEATLVLSSMYDVTKCLY